MNNKNKQNEQVDKTTNPTGDDFPKKQYDLKLKEDSLGKRETAVDSKEKTLRIRELDIQHAETQRDKGYTDERKQLDDELYEKRRQADQEIAEKREQSRRELGKEISALRKTSIDESEQEVKQKKEELSKERAQLNKQKEDVDYENQSLKSREDSLDERRQNIENDVDKKVEERKKSFDKEIDDAKAENGRLRESISRSNATISSFEELKCKLGGEDPNKVLLRLKALEESNKNLLSELTTRPTQEMQAEYDRIKGEKESIERERDTCEKDCKKMRKSKRDQDDLEGDNKFLKKKCKQETEIRKSVEAHNTMMEENLKRLQASYERKQDREARIKDIETPCTQKELPRAGKQVSELEWLKNISESCGKYGLQFPRRILHAFHTALKTSEWSPITVLAGVSGTGKSELPRLYSHFGGINFLSLSVQPNWDSPESMLGFFNSIDNKFDAQPVLQLLAQSQKEKSDDYPYGLKDVMSLILMDEMNLAHVELYFSEFLSKLELRRGMKNDLPCLNVKLGAGIQPYPLPIGRNVLWAGTMNKDETTKSLSDKVLDRGIIINFPRPTKLERRTELKPLKNQADLLSRKHWESWWCKKSEFDEARISPYKTLVEEMNDSLSKVGRALGHRVWQSIEYYMANYPDVMEAQREEDDDRLRKAMTMAFEDQIVQKVMPKLRGIETRGKSKSECLDKIRAKLVDNNYKIIEDFDLACEFGHGQFIWNSANYLNDDDKGDGLEAEEI